MLLDFLPLYEINTPWLTPTPGSWQQVSLRVKEGDTRPIVRWLVLDENAEPLDVSVSTRQLYLYYRKYGHTGVLWKQQLTKTNGGSDGLAEYRPGSSYPFLPSGMPDTGPDPIYFYAELSYVDTVSGESVRFRDALNVEVVRKFTEP